MRQYIAGNIIDNLFDVFKNKSSKKLAFKELAKWASHFQVNSKTRFENNEVVYSPFIAILINQLQRGLPTKLNIQALKEIVKSSTILDFEENNESIINVEFINVNDEIEELIFRSLHLMDPRINRNSLEHNYQDSWEGLGSNFEENFLYQDLPKAAGAHFNNNGEFIIQLLVTQRKISNILGENSNLRNIPERVRNNFEEQRSDFSIEFPYYPEKKPKGIVIEVDGPHHDTPEQVFLDTERDKAVANNGWNNTLRIKTSEFNTAQFGTKVKNILLPAIDNEFVNNCLHNYNNPLWTHPIGKEVLQICLIPFGIARIQRMLLESMAHEILPVNQESWKIAVLERDVPCAKLAIDDMLILIESINELTNEPLVLPEIDLHVFSSTEFENSPFQKSSTNPIDEFNTAEYFDLVIDISLLEKSTSPGLILSNSLEVISIRSVHYIDSKRTIATSDSIKYKPVFAELENDSGDEKTVTDKNLEYLLQSFFRKKEFRHGQIPIMNNALQCKSVIGLLPTGSGKSLTYQLSALLQPGICLVIDPIKSLMKDQVDGLLRAHIDSCVFINSTLQGEEKRRALRKMADGEVQFVFVSPERLQMEEFRNLLEDMYHDGLNFSYCVIDEAHCVSEWGHDFRTAYLRLGENAMKYCKTKNLEFVPLFGLTATASYDVLADVQRELSGNDESRRLTEGSVIRSEYTQRQELQYMIEEVTFSPDGISKIWDLKKELGKNKQDRAVRLLKDIPHTIQEMLNNPLTIYNENDWELNENEEGAAFDKIQIKDYNPEEFYDQNNAALIFCPHTKGIFGVTDKFKPEFEARNGYYDLLNIIPGVKAGYFMASGSDSETMNKVIQDESFKNQDRFINNELNLMVATKAFGMGIDKENIRYTIHVNYPSSIESYVQEAGRAGRDGKIALSYILFKHVLNL